ncbi:major facilitator superfamily domain-containing protein [Kockovaella imperatae]|uniref:Major facilitator superfamily domain-containing protein n=1 Tax=Kockovaella imperatae TaxID=4999 RepID=A0A1Y1UHQ5_9TREE|nr:major facilitator superfamily domain-containing protein [Kockovaella imperatae]ORX37004.1 major facilitator superfamily domain-containing protein [Kockovaella imperatae]
MSRCGEEKIVETPVTELAARAPWEDDKVSAVEVRVDGAAKLEAVHQAWDKKLQWAVFIGIALSAYIYSLDGVTTWQYLSYATSTVLKQSLSGTISTAQAIIIAIGKPLMAKLADVMGRAETMLLVAVLYVLGYILIATAHSIGQIAAGEIIYAFGYTGLQMLQQIIIADLTSLRWRGLATSLLTAPFIINNFVAGAIAQGVLPNWRLGYGMFAILVPVCLTPIIGVLFYSQYFAKKTSRSPAASSVVDHRVIRLALADMDFIGLILVGASLALILLPLGLAPEASKGWKTPSMVSKYMSHPEIQPAMIAVGALLFPAFLLYEWKIPKKPVLPMRWLRQSAILGACLIGFFDFISFYLQYTYLYSYIFVTENWSFLDLSYFSATQSLSLTAFGILGGIIMWASRRLKWLLLAGVCLRLLGVGLMLYARGPHGNTASLVLCQVIQGMGGGFAATCIQVAAQAAVSHADVATVTAILLLLTEVGNSVGSAISTAVWTSTMPREIAKHVPSTNNTLLYELYEDMEAVVLYPLGSPVREGVISAYQSVMLRLCLASVIISILPIVACVFLIKDIRLTRAQNDVEGTDLSGEVI